MNARSIFNKAFATVATLAVTANPLAKGKSAQIQPFPGDQIGVFADAGDPDTTAQRGEVVEFNANAGDTTGGDEATQEPVDPELAAMDYSSKTKGIGIVVHVGTSDSAANDVQITTFVDRALLKNLKTQKRKLFFDRDNSYSGSGFSVYIDGHPIFLYLSAKDLRDKAPEIDKAYADFYGPQSHSSPQDVGMTNDNR